MNISDLTHLPPNGRFQYMNERFLYKYFSERAFARGLVQKGNIRIGTTEEYKTQYENNVDISDILESKKTAVDAGFDRIITSQTLNNPENANFSQFIGVKGNERVAVKGVTFQVEYDSGNAWVFCASHTPISKNHDFGKHCVRINRPIEFIMKLHFGHMQNYGEMPFMGLVEYLDGRSYNIHQQQRLQECPGFFIKGSEYKHQNEFRAAWPPLKGRIVEPMILSVPDIREHCELIS